MMQIACDSRPEWVLRDEMEAEWKAFQSGCSDNSFYVWQWLNLGLMCLQEQSIATRPSLLAA
jgi:hypothetical protein